MEDSVPAGHRPADEQNPGGGRELGDRLRSAARGDLSAFEGVYRELSGAVYGIALRVVCDPAQAEEVAQEVFTEVWRVAARFDPAAGSARSWVLTIAHRRAVDRVRAEQASSERNETAARLAAAATAEDQVVDEVAHRLDRERVRRCLNVLTDGQREAVRLTYYTGYTQRQAAELLRVPLTTVKGRLRDGLIRLRDCIGGER